MCSISRDHSGNSHFFTCLEEWDGNARCGISHFSWTYLSTGRDPKPSQNTVLSMLRGLSFDPVVSRRHTAHHERLDTPASEHTWRASFVCVRCVKLHASAMPQCASSVRTRTSKGVRAAIAAFIAATSASSAVTRSFISFLRGFGWGWAVWVSGGPQVARTSYR